MIRVLQTPALPLGYVASLQRWCRGGDLNPYALTGTAPSRRRVYQFHHLGSTAYDTDFGACAATNWHAAEEAVCAKLRLIPEAFQGLVEEVADASEVYDVVRRLEV